MYLSSIKLWNFRKFGSSGDTLDLEQPDVTVELTKGVNVLIGENDSGKTAIIDAIKLVLDTHCIFRAIPTPDSEGKRHPIPRDSAT